MDSRETFHAEPSPPSRGTPETGMKDRAESLTRQLMIDAGISNGMRVLDIGCGRGDVTILAGEIVGEHGHVVGIDRDQAPIDAARRRVREQALSNISFECANLGSPLDSYGPFDAIVGRRVLMYQPDAVATLKRLAGVLAPGGLIVLQEHDSTSMPICQPAMPLHERVSGWIWETVAREGADVHMGLHLAPSLERAGFTVERVRAETTVLTSEQQHPISAIVGAMLERIARSGVATAADIDLETLERRLDAERRNANGTCIWELVFGAWARKSA
jgi:SAM-dependent methyltransferase